MMKKSSNEASGSSSLAVQRPDNQDVTSVFKRTEVIGTGKFGVVYKGHHARTKQVYAIKVLNLDSDEDEVEDVQREVQFLASMKQTPNITHYYGSYLKDTTLWIIIEYCAGGSLRTLLRPGKIDEKYIGIIMREVLIALKYIHKDNVIHRDIKAANVLITNEGHVKLCDFGVAAQLNQSSLKRQTMAGTPYWMAPEVIMEGVSYDTKVDIWSLGITTYEIATGNPPYCDVEALRAMQLITKSKPPRLEGRHYSPMLKEFIALCLDEDPKERLSADDLLKSKLIKHHRTASTTVLKELITRYLLFRDKTKSKRSSVSISEADQPVNDADDDATDSQDEDAEESSDPNAMQVEMRWDFDSLSSSDYIMANDINVEEIPEESAVDWKSHFDQFNFAYPDEERHYYQTGNNTGKLVYQGTTMGKSHPSMGVSNSTLNAFPTNNNSTAQPGKMFKSSHTNSTGINGSHNSNTANNSSKKTEAKAPKKLMELFEDNDVINEEEDGDPKELSRINKNLPNDLAGRPHAVLMNGAAYHSQSTPALPQLQTKFNKPPKGPTSAVTTTAPTPIEIEIPEELPTSTTTPSAIPSALPSSLSSVSMDPLAQPQPVVATNLTKPRSSTVSSHKQPSSISGRIPGGRDMPGKIPEEIPRRASGGAENSSDGSISSGMHGVNNGTAAMKLPLRTPSPSKVLNNYMNSPTKKPGSSPTGSGPPPTMKPVGTNNETKDVLLQPLNNGNPTSSNNANTGTADKETSRVNRDFKRNNPNLKLHMPLPTPMVATKLLDSTDLQSAGPPSSDNINQFGFNTSTVSNVPVSMTPISEKHMDFGNRTRRSQSVANRKNSQSADPVLPVTTSITNANNNATGSSPAVATPLNSMASQLIPPPSDFLSLDLFLDMNTDAGGYTFIDRKPSMLDKLESLLKMYEDGLPVLEDALKKQLLSMDTTYEDSGH
ncbi:hypothetical protein ZYGR_0A02830 [Zygosaccharomyces rouxii]|uniref:non-specific serine/threonine protein kinase n=2 Tax=Zygosaccharomyces rouxii TaxID=4956 RepID=C5DPV5_ZYGRC|nr:uncharacterized protein ZYRO0A06446g [Zygosaccharomyces rouxii]KAH9198763.1 hypothetical protein LQ764DRAFT_141049 [Zygosaccharomyces rouxii]GAV46689.1 hypothetical protein ZYGR_0A02830 [Zygosaccharomyces rouxii]CAR25716.1 ZYRO0A06446p [Zygosaccharomyces rouxii]